jgi:hypothetical protein
MPCVAGAASNQKGTGTGKYASFDAMILENARSFSAKIRDTDQVLDVGGWHSPWNRANAVIDIMPYATRNKPGAILKDVWPEERFNKDSFIQTDICSGPWPFKDKQFDFVLCSHTLEDVRDPIKVCEEIVRVGKAGYIEVPSRLVESTKGVERPFYCGYYHHRWLCERTQDVLSFTFKPAMLHSYRQFHFRKSALRRINPKYEALGFFWDSSFSFRENIVIDRDAVQSDLREFKKHWSAKKDLFVPKYNWAFRRL